jgi:hypothetical protein
LRLRHGGRGYPERREKNTVAMALGRGANYFMTMPVDFLRLKQDVMAVIAEAQRTL